MKFYLAAARAVVPTPVARALRRRAGARVANDNEGPLGMTATADPVIHAALRHFSRHGLDAAQQAAHEAESALRSGNRDRYDWWQAVCRTLDRRRAYELANRVRTPTG